MKEKPFSIAPHGYRHVGGKRILMKGGEDGKKRKISCNHDNGNWKVKKQGAERASKIFENKKDAVNYGREKAKNGSKGQLIIHKKDGKIQTEYTYKKDPYPPKG